MPNDSLPPGANLDAVMRAVQASRARAARSSRPEPAGPTPGPADSTPPPGADPGPAPGPDSTATTHRSFGVRFKDRLRSGVTWYSFSAILSLWFALWLIFGWFVAAVFMTVALAAWVWVLVKPDDNPPRPPLEERWREWRKQPGTWLRGIGIVTVYVAVLIFAPWSLAGIATLLFLAALALWVKRGLWPHRPTDPSFPFIKTLIALFVAGVLMSTGYALGVTHPDPAYLQTPPIKAAPKEVQEKYCAGMKATDSLQACANMLLRVVVDAQKIPGTLDALCTDVKSQGDVADPHRIDNICANHREAANKLRDNIVAKACADYTAVSGKPCPYAPKKE